MQQTMTLRVTGRYIEQNPFSEVPDGALRVASNLVIDRDGIGESRRGLTQYGDLPGVPSKLLDYNDTLLLHYDDSTLSHDVAGVWTDYSGTFAAPQSWLKMQGLELNKSFFFTSDIGVYRLDSVSGTPVRSGASRALDGSASLTGASGFLANNSAVAYRIVWGYRDANGQLLLGSPSARITIGNTAGATRNVSLNFTVPSDVISGYFYQIYRSEQALSSTDTPSDELQLVLEKPVTGAEITAGVVTVTDSATDDQKGAFIYTAPSQDGILQSNDRPPLAVDLAKFRQHVFYANTQQPYRATLSFTSNVAIADTITVAGVTYTARAAENIAADEFLVGADLTITMRSFIRVLNRSASTVDVQAFELDETTFTVETRDLPGASFTIDSSVPLKFSKSLPLTADNEAKMNRVHISKPGQGDAAPILVFADIGSGTKPIRRILAIRDAVFVCKDDGVYRITGTDINNFVVEPHDTTVRIVGANTAAVLDNRVFMMGESGVVAITTTQVDDTISRPIERELLTYSALSNFSELAWALNYDSDRKYILAVPTDAADTGPVEFHVYNYFTRSWTTWDLAMLTGIVGGSDNKLYLARESDGQVLQERKSFTINDYADDEYSVSITAFDSSTVTVASLPPEVVVGMTLRQDLIDVVITDINGLVLTVTPIDQPFMIAAATIYTPIPVTLEWLKNSAGNPGILKHFSETTVMFEDARFRTIDFLFSSNFFSGYKTVPVAARGLGDWGTSPWGDFEWGGGVGGDQPLRTYFPKGLTRAHWINLRLELAQAFNALSCSGASIQFTPMDSRFR